MLLDDVDDLLVESMFEREIHAFLDVRDNDERAHRRREIVVRIALEVHVLGEIIRLHQLADIVEIGADATKSRVRANRFRGGLGEVRDDKTVMIGAGRFDRHPAQERVIQVRGFQPGNVGRDLKELLEHRQRAADEHGGHDAVADREERSECRSSSSRLPPGSKRLIGPINPKVSASSQMARPTHKPARIRRLRRRTVWVRRTAVKPLINPMTSMGASILFNRMLLKRLTNTAP